MSYHYEPGLNSAHDFKKKAAHSLCHQLTAAKYDYSVVFPDFKLSFQSSFGETLINKWLNKVNIE